MSEPFRIYLDLDETLIHSIICRGNDGQRRRINLDGEKYSVMERSLAKSMVADCRAIARTFILTTAMREYAEAVNSVLGFGFLPEDILTRHDYIAERDGETDAVLRSGIAPNSVLIDNESPQFLYSRIKMDFLGIDANRYFTVRRFNGRDPDKFAAEWDNILSAVRHIAEQSPV